MDLSKLSDKDILALKKNDYGSLSDEAILALKGSAQPVQAPPQEPDALDTAKEYGMSALKGVGKALDYAGGLTRVPYQTIEDIGLRMMDKKPLAREGDLLRAVKGEAPTSEEYMDRAGIEPSATRTAAGIAKDIALDPTTYVGLAPLKMLLNKYSGKAGTSIYKSGLKAIDQEVAKYGKEPVSDLLMSEGVTGSAEQIQKKMDGLASSYKAERDAILKKADDAGGKVSMREAMEPLQKKINDIRASRDPNLQKVADAMEKDMKKYTDLEKPLDNVMNQSRPVTTSEASAYKSSEYNNIGDAAYKEASQTPSGKTLQKTKARGLKEATENAVAKVSGKQSAEELKSLNDKLGRLLTSKEKAAAEATKEINKNALTEVDAMALALDPKTYLAKQAAKIAKMTGPRTKFGKALVDRAKTNQLLEQNLLISPWTTMQRQMSKPEDAE